MPRRSILSATERDSLLALLESEDVLIRRYSFNETDLSLICQRRRDSNRLGFAVQLFLLRYPGYALSTGRSNAEPLVRWVARQVGIATSARQAYAEREETRREHIQEIRAYLGLTPFGAPDFRLLVYDLTDLALRRDKGLVLAARALEFLRGRQVVLPGLPVIERASAQAVTRGNRRLHRLLIEPLADHHRQCLDALLQIRPDSNMTWLSWLRQSPLRPNSRYMLEHIARLRAFQALNLPDGIGRNIHQNRLLKIAREGAQMTPQDLGKFATDRRHATLVALTIEGMATVTDEIVDLHDRILIKLFSTARNKHQLHFQQQGKAINDKVRLYSRIGHALLIARQSGDDAFSAIEAIMPWEKFAQSIAEADQLARPGSFDHLHLVRDQFNTLRRYVPQFLEVLSANATPAAQNVLDAIETLRDMNADSLRAVPANAPTAFIKPRWKPLVFSGGDLDRRNYEICALSELKNSLRSGDIWVKGSRQFRNFDDYLLPRQKFDDLRRARALPLAIDPNPDDYLGRRVGHLEQQLETVNRLAEADELPDAFVGEAGLKITPQETGVPKVAQGLIDRIAGMLPRVKITELLMDVDNWTGFTRHFVHLKSGEPAKDRTLPILVTAWMGTHQPHGRLRLAAESDTCHDEISLTQGVRSLAYDFFRFLRSTHLGSEIQMGVQHGRGNLPSLWWEREGGRSCASYGHGVRSSMHIIACIEDPVVIRKRLNHL